MSVRPGLSTKIVTDVDEAKERIVVKGSTVYDVQEPSIILAQTDPPILKSMLHKELTVTYLVKEKDDTVRHGFAAELVEFIDYRPQLRPAGKGPRGEKDRPGKGLQHQNVLSREPDRPQRHRHVRLREHGEYHRHILREARRSHMARLSCSSPMTSSRSVSRSMEGPIPSEARILRTWQGDHEGARHDLWFATAEFANMDKTVEYALSRKILDIERESRQEGSPLLLNHQNARVTEETTTNCWGNRICRSIAE